MYGHRPHGILSIMEKQWSPEEGLAAIQEPGEYVQQLHEWLEEAQGMAQANLAHMQQEQKQHYDKGSKPRAFTPGDRVLVSNTTLVCPHGDLWQGPFTVHRVLGPETYEVQCRPHSSQKPRLHITELKEWQEQPQNEECLLTSPPGPLCKGMLPWQASREARLEPSLDPALSTIQ